MCVMFQFRVVKWLAGTDVPYRELSKGPETFEQET